MSSEGKEYIGIFEDVHIVNPNIENINDLDLFANKINVIDSSLQSLYPLDKATMCLQGDLFRDNSILKKILLINFQIK